MNYKVIILRSWYYFQKGYGTYLALPIGLTSIATTIYYLAMRSIPFFDKIFPEFQNFLIILPLLYPAGVLLGWLHFRKTDTFQQEIEITMKSNPYTQSKIVPISIVTWRLFAHLARKEGLNEIADEIEETIRRSL